MAKETEKERMVKIIYETTSGRKCETTAPESRAQQEMDRLRSLPDVKAHTVRLSF